MSLMNGVDSEEIIAEQIGKSHILPAVIKERHTEKRTDIISIQRQHLGSSSVNMKPHTKVKG